MGYGNYSHEAHTILSQKRADLPTQQVFTQTACHNLMNPKDVRARESRDSVEHPSSLSVVFALDVTGSMGEIPEMLARQELPKFMKILADCKVDDPQLLFLAVGDATSDTAPLQVGQFESTAELMDRWLTWSYLEGRGGGQKHESYELALYFLAEHTDLDCWVKRKKPGYLFMTGDELPYPAVSRHQVEALIGDRLDEDIPVAAVVAAVQETFRPFFLIPDPKRRDLCERAWRDLLGDHVIAMESPRDTCYAAAGIVALSERVVPDLDGVARVITAAGAPPDRVGAVIRALTPYAATLGKAGVPAHRTEAASVPTGAGQSLWQRLKKAIG
jgi:hypothetical protein